MTSNCASSLAPNTNCSLGLAFAPLKLGGISGTVTLTANDGSSPHTIQLGGTATGFALSPATGSPASATVPAGQPATFQLSLALQTFSGTVTLTCTPTPSIPNATCSISPNPVTLSGAAATAVTVSVTTAPRTSTSAPPDERPFGAPGAFRLLIPVWALLALLSLSLGAVSRKLRRIPLAFLTAVLMLLLIWGCASGGGSPSSTTPGGGSTGTPAGTYHLLVTATSGGVSTGTTLTLIIQ